MDHNDFVTTTQEDISELTAIAGRTRQAIHTAVDRELKAMDAEIDRYLKARMRQRNKASARAGIKSKLKFNPLFEYFRVADEPRINLTFDELGDIIGEPLCKSAHKYREYWTRYGRGRLADCWRANGYKIKKLDLENKHVSFYQVGSNGYARNDPDSDYDETRDHAHNMTARI